MKWRANCKIGNRLWHRWFAWRRVRIGFYWVWLETVQRRWVPAPADARESERGKWEYKPATEPEMAKALGERRCPQPVGETPQNVSSSAYNPGA